MLGRSKNREFRTPIKITLACRSGYNCNICGCNTIGPRLDDPNKATSWGEAGHIVGNAENGPRCNPDMPDEDVRDISNGIWLCRNCHKKVDCNESTFTVEDLLEKKFMGEKRAWDSLPKEGDDKLGELIGFFFKKVIEYNLSEELSRLERISGSLSHWKEEDKNEYQEVQKKIDNINGLWEREILPILNNILLLLDYLEGKKINKIGSCKRKLLKYINNFLLNEIIGLLNEKKIKYGLNL